MSVDSCLAISNQTSLTRARKKMPQHQKSKYRPHHSLAAARKQWGPPHPPLPGTHKKTKRQHLRMRVGKGELNFGSHEETPTLKRKTKTKKQKRKTSYLPCRNHLMGFDTSLLLLPSTLSIPSLGRLSPSGHAHPMAVHPSMPPHPQLRRAPPGDGTTDSGLKGHPGHPPSGIKSQGNEGEEGLVFYLGCGKQPKKPSPVVPLPDGTAYCRWGDMGEDVSWRMVVVYICMPRLVVGFFSPAS